MQATQTCKVITFFFFSSKNEQNIKQNVLYKEVNLRTLTLRYCIANRDTKWKLYRLCIVVQKGNSTQSTIVTLHSRQSAFHTVWYVAICIEQQLICATHSYHTHTNCGPWMKFVKKTFSFNFWKKPKRIPANAQPFSYVSIWNILVRLHLKHQCVPFK